MGDLESMKALILSWLISLQWTPADRATETPEARLERLTTIAESVADLTRGDARKAGFVLIQFKRETDFDLAVQRCECKRYQCDARKTVDGIEFLAHSLSQAHEVGFPDTASWFSLCGTERANVDANVRFVLRFYRQDMACGFANLGGTMWCQAGFAQARARQAEALSRRVGGR
jgi:hypothetical protein